VPDESSFATAFPTSMSAVARVLDYEPPAFGGPPVLPPVTQLRPRPMPGRPTAGPTGPDPRAAAAFADAALRRVLEVIDRRRPLSQLRQLLAPGLVDSLLTGAARGTEAGPARLRRVLAQMSLPDGTVAEVVANYTRGERVHAIACRIEQVTGATGNSWQVVALHLG
jgi:hypothetical protein